MNLMIKITTACLFGLLTMNSIAQSIFNLFEAKDNMQIEQWIQSNPNTKIDLLNEQLSKFYGERLPISKLQCLESEIHVLNLAMLYNNDDIVQKLLKNPKILENQKLLSESLNFAVAQNKMDLARNLEKLGAVWNQSSPFFFGRNTLQIALLNNVSADLLELAIQKTSDEQLIHLDCLGKSVLHYYAQNTQMSSLDMNKFQKTTSFFLGDDELEFPIELAAISGNLSRVKDYWNAMKLTDSLSNYANDANFRRLKYHAVLSKNVSLSQWVDSVTTKFLKLDKQQLGSFYLGNEPYNLSYFLNEGLTLSALFLDIKKNYKDAVPSTFLEIIKLHQTKLQTEVGIQLPIQPTFHGRSKLIPLRDMIYISRFINHPKWTSSWFGSLSPQKLLDFEQILEPTWDFVMLKHPSKFQCNYVIDEAELLGYRGDELEQATYILSQLPVLFLKVKQVTDLSFDLRFFFPKIQFVEIEWSDAENKEIALSNELLALRELKFTGVEKIIFPSNYIGKELEKIHIGGETTLENLPKGVKVVYF